MVRILGWLLLLGGAAILAFDILVWYRTGAFRPSAVGTLWNAIDPTSLQLAQPAIQRHLAPWLWDDVVLPVLLWPAAAVLAVPGLFLLWVDAVSQRRRLQSRRSQVRAE